MFCDARATSAGTSSGDRAGEQAGSASGHASAAAVVMVSEAGAATAGENAEETQLKGIAASKLKSYNGRQRQCRALRSALDAGAGAQAIEEMAYAVSMRLRRWSGMSFRRLT